MFEILQNFERTALQLNTIVLICTGIVCVLAGLFVWLGGLGLRKVLVAVAGGVGGGMCGFFITGQNAMLSMVWAGVAVVIALIFERIFITIMAAALAAVLGFVVMGQIRIEQAGSLRQVCSQMPVYSWVIISVMVIISITAGFFFRRLTSALCYATLGTMLVFAGMILLLSYKGSEPISYINRNRSFYAMVFAAMAAFGTIEQLLLCWVAKAKLTEKKQVNKGKEESEEKPSSWRSK